MQKRTFSLITSLLLVFALAGCQTTAGSTSQPAAAQISSVQNKLAAGTLLLEGTGRAVTTEQAAELLPLWKAVKSLSKSDIASADEVQALYDQITETMKAEQIQAVKDMSISQADMASLVSKYGAQRLKSNSSGSSSGSASSSSSSSSPQPGGLGSDMGGGMPPDGGGMMGGTDMVAAQTVAATGGQSSTITSAQTTKTGTLANANLLYIDALITLLQQRVDA